MSCVNQQKTVFKGEYKLLVLTVTDDEQDPVDLTAATALEFQVKTAVGAADPPLIGKAIGTGVTLRPQAGITLGQAEIEIQTSDTSALAPGTYYYDVVLVLAGKRYFVVPPSEFIIKGVINLP